MRLLERRSFLNILHVVGARPNFIKVAPVYRALQTRKNVRQALIHTGQHYDANMSAVFFHELGIPLPDVNLGVGSGTQAQQTAEIMIRLEPVVLEQRPDTVLVYGDVNSTVAAALVSAKVGILVGHVEAGLRSFDRSMPEEINRIVTDQLADFLFTATEDGNFNLRREGIAPEKVHLVGNVMIDSLVRLLPEAKAPDLIKQSTPYALLTLHRPSNVDDKMVLHSILQSLLEVNRDLPLLFPAHPRTRRRIEEFGLNVDGLKVLDPMPYIQFLALQRRAAVVITDSGGVQEETTYLRVPCLTLRENTERPVTITLGTNILVGSDARKLKYELLEIMAGRAKKGTIPPLWDGHAAERIADVMLG